MGLKIYKINMFIISSKRIFNQIRNYIGILLASDKNKISSDHNLFKFTY